MKLLKVLLLDNIVSFSEYISWKMYIFLFIWNDENEFVAGKKLFYDCEKYDSVMLVEF